MYTKFISKPIQEKLKAKERALARLGNQPQEQQNDDSLELKDLAWHQRHLYRIQRWIQSHS